MENINIYDAKTNFSSLIEEIMSGKKKEIIICKYGKKVAKIVPYVEEKKTKRIGAAVGELPKIECDIKDEKIFGDIAKEFGY